MKSEKIVLGGGCFWCTEAVFQMLRGVESVTSGYAGGKRPNPTYDSVMTGVSGHAEVIQVEFDPSVIMMDDILSVFFSTHDPTSLNRQGNDVGPEYRSAIFYTSLEQKAAIDAFVAKLMADKTFSKPIVTEFKPLEAFYPAEGYHQNYYRNNQALNPYCQFVIDPKVAKLRENYARLLKEEQNRVTS